VQQAVGRRLSAGGVLYRSPVSQRRVVSFKFKQAPGAAQQNVQPFREGAYICHTCAHLAVQHVNSTCAIHHAVKLMCAPLNSRHLTVSQCLPALHVC
jgi:hypothetical protein